MTQTSAATNTRVDSRLRDEGSFEVLRGQARRREFLRVHRRPEPADRRPLPTQDRQTRQDAVEEYFGADVDFAQLVKQLRRFTRLTDGFSNKLDNLKVAVAVFMAWYNFCRVHPTLRVTPAMEAGLPDPVWSLRELLTAESAERKVA